MLVPIVAVSQGLSVNVYRWGQRYLQGDGDVFWENNSTDLLLFIPQSQLFIHASRRPERSWSYLFPDHLSFLAGSWDLNWSSVLRITNWLSLASLAPSKPLNNSNSHQLQKPPIRWDVKRRWPTDNTAKKAIREALHPSIPWTVQAGNIHLMKMRITIPSISACLRCS